MGHGKETPRQKMIGMMYLVLMAMLALNVSNQVLDAFTVLNDGLSKTKHSIEETNKILIANFKKEYELNEQKVVTWYYLANEVKRKADSIVNFIDEKKLEILIAAQEDTALIFAHGHLSMDDIKGKDKTDPPAIVMIGDNNDKAGSLLKSKVNSYKEFLLNDALSASAKEGLRRSIEKSLETNDRVKHGESTDWARSRFEHLPQSGVLSIMTGIQINVRNAEAEVLKYLYNKIDEGTFKFTNLDATVIPNSSYIIRGNQYNAEVFIAARDSTAIPRIHVAESKNPYDSVEMTEEPGRYRYFKNPDLTYETILADKITGKAIYKKPGNSLGSKYWGGIIELIGPAGDTIARPFKRSYMVAEGAVTVAPTKMNVFYLGVDNPVDISVAGVKPELVSVGITNGKIIKRGNSYIVNPRRRGNSNVTVYATIDGVKRQMGIKEFRVKQVPDPVGKVMGKKSGGIGKQELLAQIGVEADLENFVFDIKYRVTQFTVSASIQGFRKDEISKSYKFTEAQKNLIESLPKGKKVYIEEIKAVGPDGSTRSLPAIALLLK